MVACSMALCQQGLYKVSKPTLTKCTPLINMPLQLISALCMPDSVVYWLTAALNGHILCLGQSVTGKEAWD